MIPHYTTKFGIKRAVNKAFDLARKIGAEIKTNELK